MHIHNFEGEYRMCTSRWSHMLLFNIEYMWYVGSDRANETEKEEDVLAVPRVCVTQEESKETKNETVHTSAQKKLINDQQHQSLQMMKLLCL